MRSIAKLLIAIFTPGLVLIASESNLKFAIGQETKPTESKMNQDEVKAPVASRKATKLEKHGHVRLDNFYLMYDREDPKVILYLNSENDYLKKPMKPTEALQKALFEETKARIKQTDTSVATPNRGYDYYSRTEEGKQYSVYCRRKTGTENEEIILDVNQLAEGHEFCRVAGLSVSANTKILAYAVDTVGRRKYSIKFKSLENGEMFSDEVANVTGNLVWAEDNKTVFYARQDEQTLRSFQIYKHTLGTDSDSDELVFEEKDEQFSCYVGKSRSRKYIMIFSNQTLSTEVRFTNSTGPFEEFTVLQPREQNHEYSADHFGDHFYIRTNDKATNFRLVKAPESNPGKENWTDVVPHSENDYFEAFELYKDFMAIEIRKDGLVQLLYRANKDGEQGEWDPVEFNDPAYVAGISATPETDTKWLRYGYTSMTTPYSTYERNIETGEVRLLKQTEVLGGFDAKNYRSERQWVTAHDGVKVPISIVYHKDTPRDGTAPCLLYGYGSYGSSMDPSFNSTRLNLLDRGFVYVIGHIRGGQELGRKWYEDGKLFKKKNTFTDFVDIGKYLIANKYSDPKRLYSRGGSAGGLLIGAAINIAPDLFHGVIADVPFVDVVTTMLDTSIPLTTSEFDEWGNPAEKPYYDYMLSYSPYDNVQTVDYPNILVTTGLHDSQVQYWEPAKWVAKLRYMKTDDNLLLMKINMSAGHGGASGRYDRYKELAMRHAFLLMLSGKDNSK